MNLQIKSLEHFICDGWDSYIVGHINRTGMVKKIIRCSDIRYRIVYEEDVVEDLVGGIFNVRGVIYGII